MDSLADVAEGSAARLFASYGPDIIELIGRFVRLARGHEPVPRVSAPAAWSRQNFAATNELIVEWTELKCLHNEAAACHLVTTLTLSARAEPTDFVITCSGCLSAPRHVCDFAKLDVATFLWNFERLLNIQSPERITAARGTKRPIRLSSDAPASPPRASSPKRVGRKPKARPDPAKAPSPPRMPSPPPDVVTLDAAEFCSVVRMVIDNAADAAYVAPMLFGALTHCRIVAEHANMAVLLMPQLTDDTRAQAVLRECSRLPPGIGRIAAISRILMA